MSPHLRPAALPLLTKMANRHSCLLEYIPSPMVHFELHPHFHAASLGLHDSFYIIKEFFEIFVIVLCQEGDEGSGLRKYEEGIRTDIPHDDSPKKPVLMKLA